jgi:hypothetical protein
MKANSNSSALFLTLGTMNHCIVKNNANASRGVLFSALLHLLVIPFLKPKLLDGE